MRDETERALATYEDTRFVQLPKEDQQAYGRLLAANWNKGQSLAIVEQDIVVRPDIIEAFRNHPEGYICFPYPWRTDIGPALGCVRWSSEFMEAHPTVMDEAVAQNVSYLQFDVVLMRHILVRRYGIQPTVLLPPAEHLNEAKALLPEASREPLMSLPAW